MRKCKWSAKNAETVMSDNLLIKFETSCCRMTGGTHSFCGLHRMFIRYHRKLCMRCGRVPYARYVPFLLHLPKNIAALIANKYITEALCCGVTHPKTDNDYLRLQNLYIADELFRMYRICEEKKQGEADQGKK